MTDFQPSRRKLRGWRAVAEFAFSDFQWARRAVAGCWERWWVGDPDSHEPGLFLWYPVYVYSVPGARPSPLAGYRDDVENWPSN